MLQQRGCEGSELAWHACCKVGYHRPCVVASNYHLQRLSQNPTTQQEGCIDMQSSFNQTDTVDQLNSFLRGELSAAESYREALAKLPNATSRTTLEQCARSHQERANLLTREVRRLGGQPAESSGAWGSFAKLVTNGAQIFGEKAAIAALEEGEDHGRNDYQRDLGDLDVETRTLIERQVLPEQLRTHNAMSALKKSLS